jgi:translation initiation factor IF-2
MAKVRVHEIAKELGVKSKEVVEKAQEMGLAVKAASSGVTLEEAEGLMNFFMNGTLPKSEPKAKKEPVRKEKKVVQEEKPTSSKEESETQPEREVTPPAVEEVLEKKEVPTSKEEKKPVATPSNDEPAKEVKSEEKTAPKEEEEKSEKVEPLSSKSTAKRRRGLIIKKKKKKVEEPKQDEHFSTPTASNITTSYGKMSEEAKKELEQKRKKSAGNTPAQKKESGNRLNIFGSRSLESNFAPVVDEEDEQVVLLDYKEMQLKEKLEEQERERQQQQQKNRNRPNTGRSGGGQQKSLSRNKRRKSRPKQIVKEEVIKSIEIPEDIRVYEFAEKVNRPISDVIKTLFTLGTMVTKNDYLDKDAIEILAEEFEVEVHTIDPTDQFDYVKVYDGMEDENSEERPPVITIMGHVDHGKTSLLDTIRNSRVADREAGGITQHIGAYSIDKDGKLITFLDTPGHEAFSAIRSRGAQITDVIVIVVAADDGVKPQTKEAVQLALESDAAVLVAVNKMDKPEANPDLVMGQMAELGMTPVDWGGEVDFVKISAKTGEGIEELLEHILIQAEVLELTGDATRLAKAVVVESSLEKGRGAVATVVVQNGTLNVGDNVVVGSAYGRVKSILDDHKKPIKALELSQTGVVVGLDKVPNAGEILVATEDDKEARRYAELRHEYDRHKELSVSTKVSLDELTDRIAEGNLKALKVILKTDVHGSLEAIRTSLDSLRNDEVKITLVTSGVGGISESDVELANNTEDCVILGFNVRPTGQVKAKAKQYGVDIKTYSIIYEMINDMTAILTGMMKPVLREENTGQAEVRETFPVPKIGTVAGCMVTDGQVIRGGKARLIRDGVVVYTGTINSLKRFKDDVKEVGKGYECGIMFDDFNEIEQGDYIETFKEVEEKAKI